MSQTASPILSDVNIGYRLEVGTTVTFVCAFVVVGLRALARGIYGRMGWDDYSMIFALVQALLATVFDFIAVNYGLGRHLVFLKRDEVINASFYSLLSQVFCVNALSFAKISICLSYLRILKGSYRMSLQAICCITAVLVFAVNTVVIVSLYVQCKPAKKSWDPFLSGSCWHFPVEASLVLLQGAFSALTDFFLCILPVFLLKDMQANQVQKVILLFLMGLGLITGVFATIRSVENGKTLNKPQTDNSYTTVMGLLWAGMERNIAMLVASVPAMRPLMAPLVKYTSKAMSYLRSGPPSNQVYEMGSSKQFSAGENQRARGYQGPGNSHMNFKAMPSKDDDGTTSRERILLQQPSSELV